MARINLHMSNNASNKLVPFLIAGMSLGIILLFIFADLAEDMLNAKMLLFDQSIITALAAHRSPAWTGIMKAITDMGSPLTMIGIALLVIGLLMVKKYYWDAFFLVIALSGGDLLNNLLKSAFHRSRPEPPALIQASGFSFPSGHAMVSLVFYGMLVYLILANREGKQKYALAILITALIVAIGVSRIYLGVHFPSDVAAGYAAGGFWLTGCIMGLKTARHLNRGLQPNIPK